MKTERNTASRFKRIMLGLGTSSILKIFTFVCSFVLTRLIIFNYGSEINGMISSIVQFLGFITLLEGGIGGVARAALYKPLAQKNQIQINKIISYIERFFKLLAGIFIIYSIIIAFIFPAFSTEHSSVFTGSLVLIISISLFCEYFFGMSYSILLVSDQKSYIPNSFSFVATILNFILSLILIQLKMPIHLVKIVSALVLVLKPLILSIYCKKKYNIQKIKLNFKENLIPQKWSGLGVHLAYCLHRNTDIFLITIFLSLSSVSVYSVYNMVISGVITAASALSTGFEAALGNMYSCGEINNLKEKFKSYVFYYQLLCTILLSSTIVLIVPFVQIYTYGVTDADYFQPLFAVLFVIAEFLYCLRVPFNDLMVCTNSFKSNSIGAYIEAGINILVSLLLLFSLGLCGIVIGTMCAMLFRLIYFLWFFNKKKIHIGVNWFAKNSVISFISLFFCCFLSYFINVDVGNTFASWVPYAFIITIFNTIIVLLFNGLFLKKELSNFAKYLLKKIKRN